MKRSCSTFRAVSRETTLPWRRGRTSPARRAVRLSRSPELPLTPLTLRYVNAGVRRPVSQILSVVRQPVERGDLLLQVLPWEPCGTGPSHQAYQVIFVGDAAPVGVVRPLSQAVPNLVRRWEPDLRSRSRRPGASCRADATPWWVCNIGYLPTGSKTFFHTDQRKESSWLTGEIANVTFCAR